MVSGSIMRGYNRKKSKLPALYKIKLEGEGLFYHCLSLSYMGFFSNEGQTGLNCCEQFQAATPNYRLHASISKVCKHTSFSASFDYFNKKPKKFTETVTTVLKQFKKVERSYHE